MMWLIGAAVIAGITVWELRHEKASLFLVDLWFVEIHRADHPIIYWVATICHFGVALVAAAWGGFSLWLLR